MRATKICISILKGGEGKTTIAINLAAFLANEGKKVLIIGEDPQEDITDDYLLGSEGFDEFNHNTLSDAIAGDIDIHDAIYTTLPYQRYKYSRDTKEHKVMRTKLRQQSYTIDMIPAGKATANIDTDDLRYYDHILSDLYDEYDYILFDTPPAANDSTLLVYMICDYLIIPVNSASGIKRLSALIGESVAWAWSHGSRMQILGAVQNMYAGTRRLSTYKSSMVGDYDNIYVYKTLIRNSADVENAYMFATPIASYSMSPVTADFYVFYLETLGRIKELKTR